MIGGGFMGRVIWIVLDSVGMGALPDAGRFGDEGADTIAHTWEYNGGLAIPNMLRLGWGNIDGMRALPRTECPAGAYARAAELSNGKDTTVGHWEMAGVISKKAFPHLSRRFSERNNRRIYKKNGCVRGARQLRRVGNRDNKKTWRGA